MNAVVVDQDSLHFEIRSLTIFFRRELNEGVLQAVASLLIANHLAGENFAEAREDQFQILVLGDRIQLADKEDLLGRRHIRKR
jgi:hypothetical protein